MSLVTAYEHVTHYLGYVTNWPESDVDGEVDPIADDKLSVYYNICRELLLLVARMDNKLT